MNWLGAFLTVCVLVPSARCASDAIPWCYHLPTCNDSTWSTIATKYCNGSRQSPINIVPTSAQPDSSLTPFTFHNFNITTAMKSITNTGKTVKVNFNSGISISGGGLPDAYDSLQFHLHWGNGAAVPGSEHTVDGTRYPMELHIVNVKAVYDGNTTLAVKDSTGLAALGFLIEEMPGDATGQPPSWNKLTSYLARITNSGESVSVTPGVTLDELLPGVNRSSYYRYLGSLTTPSCNEAVVWTVFKDSVKVSKDLIDLFSNIVHVTNSSSPLVINNFRGIQPVQQVTTQASSTSKTCYSLGLLALSVLLGRL